MRRVVLLVVAVVVAVCAPAAGAAQFRSGDGLTMRASSSSTPAWSRWS